MKNRKKLIIIGCISVLVMAILALATSYALFRLNVTKDTDFKVKVGNLELTIDDTNLGNTVTDGKIIMNAMEPMKEATALTKDGYNFKLKNTGSIDAFYTIYLDDIILENETKERLDNSLIRVNLTNNTIDESHTYALNDITDRVLETGSIDANHENSYTLRIWLDYSADNSAQNKYFAAQIRVEGVQSNSVRACMLQSGQSKTVGAKYICNLGDDVNNNFYVLSVDNTNNTVDLILDRNITQGTSTPTMNWNDAIAYFDSGDGLAIKNSWTKALNVDLPSAQAIADAGGITGWNYNTATTSNYSYFGVNSTSDTSQRANYNWLYNYTRECTAYGCSSGTSLSSPEAYGYWTKDLVQNDSSNAWRVNGNGSLAYYAVSFDTYHGVRPVVTLNNTDLN